MARLHSSEVITRPQNRPFKWWKSKIFRDSALNPITGEGAYSAPKPPAVLLLTSLAFCCKQKLLFFHSLASKLRLRHCMPSRRSFYDPADGTSSPQWTLGSHVRQKIMFAGHDVRQKNFRYFWAWVYIVRYRCLCIISASCLVTSHWTLETLENSVF